MMKGKVKSDKIGQSAAKYLYKICAQRLSLGKGVHLIK